MPFSERKRALSEAFVPSAPVLRIWQPLLAHMQSLHPALTATLLAQIISCILSAEEESSVTDLGSDTLSLVCPRLHPSYRASILTSSR